MVLRRITPPRMDAINPIHRVWETLAGVFTPRWPDARGRKTGDDSRVFRLDQRQEAAHGVRWELSERDHLVHEPS